MREILHVLIGKFERLLHRRRVEREMAEELEFHLAMRRERYSDGGSDPGDAWLQARREFGAVDKWKEFCRDVWQFRFVENLWHDMLFAARMLRKSPAFTVVALLTLALAIGANTAIFSLINAVLLRPLPVPHAERLVILRIQPSDYGYGFCYPILRYLESRREVFAQTFAFTTHTFQVRGLEATERVPGALVSGEYFEALQVPPAMGRTITPADDREGGGPAGPVAVISMQFWKSWLHANPAVIGEKIVLDNVAFTIVGVMPERFTGPEAGTKPNVFAALAVEPLVDAPYSNIAGSWRSYWFRIGARLRVGVSTEQANAYLRATSGQVFSATIPNPNWEYGKHKRSELFLKAEPGATGFSYLRLRYRQPLAALMVLVTLVLLIACMNVASLLMARSAARDREITTRCALGASRGRLLQQFLTESLVLASLGAALGLVAAPAFARGLMGFLNSNRSPVQLDVAPDVRVLMFTAAVAVLTTVLTGLAPGLRSTGRDLQSRLRESSAALRGSERNRIWPRMLLASEVALALVLVTGAGLLGSSLIRLHQVPTGFEAQGLVLLPLEMHKQSRDGNALMRFYQEAGEALSSIPGVERVSYADLTPISSTSWTTGVTVPGRPEQELYRNSVGPDYFRTMRTALLAGREFRWNDTDVSGGVAILNQAAANALFPKQNPIGQHVYDGKVGMEVVGLVQDSKYTNLRDAPQPTIYTPITQAVKNRPSFIALLRVSGSIEPAIASARAVIRKLAPEIPVPEAISMQTQIDDSIATERLMAMLALFFGALALLITGIGLYGTLAYATARRTGEIGIRIALGANRTRVLSLVLRQNAGIAVGGCLAGLLASMMASRWIASFLYGVSARSPFVLGAAVGALAAIALIASVIPALRATRIDPIAAIRYE